MIGQPGSHRRRAMLPPPRRNSIHLQAKRLDRATKVVDHVFPGRVRSVHAKQHREAEPLAHQAAIHVTHRQVPTLDVGRRTAQLGDDLLRIPKDHAQLRADDTAPPVALFDHLEILPALYRAPDFARVEIEEYYEPGIEEYDVEEFVITVEYEER